MCKILSCQLKDRRLPQEVKDRQRLTMKRTVIDSEQGFGLWMEMDHVSHNTFHVVPPKYRRPSYCPRILPELFLLK